MISIDDNDIQYAENILFGRTGLFDNERKEFIKNLGTIDLQAVPGSGKTTVLLAKLLILEKYMPFSYGSGVLVLSHTNAAVDEIKKRIGKYCPKLFSYPNFVGTIQSFVDNFLAIPFYINQFKTKPYRIDDEIYNERVTNIINKLWFYKFKLSNETIKKIIYIKNVDKSVFYSTRFAIDEDNKIILTKSLNSDKLEIKKPRGRTKKQNYTDYTENEKKELYEWFKKFKTFLLQEGILHYDDAYFLANLYLLNYPKIKELLRNRFHYVFVDEMQDMDKYQLDLLENIFYDNGLSNSFYQRIGDKNQSIFRNKVKLDDIWKQRNIQLIKGSHRLTPQIANLVERLALTPYEIIGFNRNDDGTVIKPHIIIYDDNTIKEVIPKFAELIKDFQEKNKIPKEQKHKFKAIGWIKEPTTDDRIAISSYWNDYSLSGYKKLIDYKVLKDYLLFNSEENNTLEIIRKNILNAFLKIMRLEEIKDEDGRNYTKRKLLFYLKNNKINEYEELKLKIYQWSIDIVKGKIDDVYNSIKEYIPEFLDYFEKNINSSIDFINSESKIIIEEIEVIEQSNKYKSDNIEIEIGTIHSAKGQTHTATLYLETFYQGKYESEYLAEAILGNAFNPSRKYQKQAAKMAYVGFSRPTHLLCLAIHKDRFDTLLSEINNEIWEIIRL